MKEVTAVELIHQATQPIFDGGGCTYVDLITQHDETQSFAVCTIEKGYKVQVSVKLRQDIWSIISDEIEIKPKMRSIDFVTEKT